MWKTHVFRKALGPQLQQIDPEYVIPKEEVLNSFLLAKPAHPVSSNKMVQNPWPALGSHFTSFQLLLMYSSAKGSPPMKKVIMTVQPDLLQSASKRRQTSASIAPRVLTKKRKMITKRVIKKLAPASPSPSESNTNQVTHHSRTYIIRMYLGWL